MERTIEERVDGLETRVKSVEGWMDDFKLKWSDAVREIQANTALTEEIHGDTKDIVAAVKWFSTTRRLCLALCVGITSLCAAALGVIKLAHELGWLH